MADDSFHSILAGAVGDSVTFPSFYSNVITDYVCWFAGVAVVLVGFPFDTVKVLQQTHPHLRLPEILRTVYRNQLSNGFLRGLSWPLCTVPFTNAVFFGVNNTALQQSGQGSSQDDVGWRRRFIAGCIGSFVETTFVIPIDYVKVILQSQAAASKWQQHVNFDQPRYFRGPVAVGMHVHEVSGLVGFYKGASLMFCREVPFGGLFMVNFDQIKRFLQDRGLSDSRGLVADSLGGGIAGCINWGLGMPIDVIKSRYQGDMVGKYRSMTDCVYQSYRTEGLRVFFRGTLVTFLRAFPVNAANTCIVFQTLKLLESRNDR
ncbi:solute carrier family 25 member 45-like [Argopecten irradians]|uniref:solute carrier family 25 member 45-like n=1 Tax=Argopecten irradians TaxID=31199 RepID=UPI003722BE91